MINTYSFLSLQNVFILIIKLRFVSCSEYSVFKEQQGPLWGCGSREWGSCPVFNLGPSLTAQGRTSCLAWKRRPIVASVVPANGPHGRKASLLGSMGTFHPVHTGLKGAVFKVMSSYSIHRWRALLSQVTRQRDFTPMGRWPLLSTEKEGQKKPEQALERKTSLQRERNRGRKNSSSKYSAEVQDATQRTSHLPHIMHPYTPAVNKCGQVDIKLYHPARVLGKEELRTCPYTGIKGRQLGGPVCCWAWKKLRQQGPLNSQPVTFDQHQRVLLGGIWK